jgi:hypothetical protein
MEHTVESLLKRAPGEYLYIRLNPATGEETSRVLELLPDGEIGKGRARCEAAWDVIKNSRTGLPMLVLQELVPGAGTALKKLKVAELHPDDERDWDGSWVVYDKTTCQLLRRI